MGSGHHYTGAAGAEYFAYQSLYRDTRARLNADKFRDHIAPTDTVVDFGCGEALMVSLLPGTVKIGIEPNEHARSAAAERGVHVAATSDELEAECADVVISNHTLEHTLDPHGELCKLRRLLRPSGRLILWLPLDDWRTQRKPRTDPNHHLYTWTPLLLRNLLDEAGFAPIDIGIYSRAWPPRGTEALAGLPSSVFDIICRVTAVALRRRQLYAIAALKARPPQAVDRTEADRGVLQAR